MGLLGLALVILLAPFVAFLLNAFGGRRVWRLAGSITILGVGAAFVTSVLVFLRVQGGERLDWSFPWLTVAPNLGRSIDLGVQVDPLTAVMLLAVTGVSLLVQIYSWGYLHETELDAHGHPHVHRDPGFGRYYTYMALFTFAMLGLVLANNFLFLFISWELVGLCSYLLIGFWFDRGPSLPRPLHGPAGQTGAMTDARLSPPDAAKKAFLTTRLGDFGFLIGLLFIWWQFGTFNFSIIEHGIVDFARTAPEALTVICLLLFCGAVGKSAQFPLHVWLPDAMEGPTPVSALIHAATMVAAGVYLVSRSFFMFEHAPWAMLVVALIGGFTAFFAATMGLVNNDIKRVMAYSTVSQLGYMMLALGVGALGAGFFHLFTHSWFKALLFLTAGAVIHGTGSQDMREMGGLAGKMKGTFVAMLVAGLSLAGIAPLSGFWSKDSILAAVSHHQPPALPGSFVPIDLLATGLLQALALVTVLMTAFYTGRVLFLTFGGSWRGDPHHYDHVHEAPPAMLWPMLILIVPSIFVGFWGSPLVADAASFFSFVEGHVVHEEMNVGMAVSSLFLALLGLAIAWAMYSARTINAAAVTRMFGPLYGWAQNKWGFDALYNALVGGFWVGLAYALSLFDLSVVDGIVNGISRGVAAIGRAGRAMQTGQVQTYAWMVFGGLLIVAAAVVLPIILGFRV